MEKKENKMKCAHELWFKGFDLELIGYSKESKLALIWCNQCEEQHFIEFELNI